MKTYTNDQLIKKASNGSMSPLLAKLRGGVQTSAGTGGKVGQDGGVADELWYDVLLAHNQGVLDEAQFSQCLDAIGAR